MGITSHSYGSQLPRMSSSSMSRSISSQKRARYSGAAGEKTGPFPHLPHDIFIPPPLVSPACDVMQRVPARFFNFQIIMQAGHFRAAKPPHHGRVGRSAEDSRSLRRLHPHPVHRGAAAGPPCRNSGQTGRRSKYKPGYISEIMAGICSISVAGITRPKVPAPHGPEFQPAAPRLPVSGGIRFSGLQERFSPGSKKPLLEKSMKMPCRSNRSATGPYHLPCTIPVKM